MKIPLLHVLRLSFCSLALCASATAVGTKIGVLLKDRTPGFWAYADKGANEAAQKLGVSIELRAPISVMDVGAQSRLLSSWSGEELGALVIAPINPESVEKQVAALAAKGVKIVALDTPLKDGLANTLVASDHQAMSDAAAKLFLSIVNDGDEVALLRNNNVDRPVMIREKTAMDALKARGKFVVHADIYASSERDSEEDRAKTLLEKYPNTKAIFASATRGTLATIKVIRDKGLVGKVKVVGFGLYLPPEVVAAFKDGILFGWIAQQPKDIGFKGVEAAKSLMEGKSTPTILHPEFTAVTPDTYSDPKVQSALTP